MRPSPEEKAQKLKLRSAVLPFDNVFKTIGFLAPLLGTLVFLFAGIIAIVVIFPQGRLATNPANPLAMIVVMLAIYFVFLGMAWFQFRRRKIPLMGSLFPRNGTNPLALSWGLAVTALLMLGSVAVGFADDGIRNAWLPEFKEKGTALPLDSPVFFLILVVAAPFVEEIFFRGYLLHRLARRWGATAGLIVSSVVFALCHQNPFGHLLFALVLGLLVLKTRSLTAAVLCHAGNNLLAVVLGWAANFLPFAEDPFPLTGVPLAVAMVLALAVLVGFGWVCKRYWPTRYPKTLEMLPVE